MLRERAGLIENTLFFCDLLITIASFLMAYYIRDALTSSFFEVLWPFSHYLNLLLAVLPIWAVLFRFSNLYRSYRTSTIFRECVKLIRIIASCGVILGFIIFLLKDYLVISRLFFAIFLTLDIILLISVRVALRIAARYARKKGFNSRNMIIVGCDRRAREFARMVKSSGGWGYKVLGFVSVDDNGGTLPEKELGGPILGNIDNLKDVVLNNVVDEVVFLVSRRKLDEMEDLFLFLEDIGVNAKVALNFFPNVIARTYISSLKGIPLLSFSTLPRDGAALVIKTAMDKVLSVLLIILSSPLMLTAAALIWLSSPGPILMKQVRCGLNGRKFVLYKFRSMIPDAEIHRKSLDALNEMDGPVFKIKNDPRVTPVGRWLRKASIDEIPQLFNVLKGDMSLVGPRPALPEEVDKYERWQRRRLSMKPGMTCLWQINGRNKVDFEHWMRMDLDYIDNWRLELDIKILLKTIPVVLSCNGM